MNEEKRCEDCFFWGNKVTGMIGCNYMIMTGKSRVVMGAVSEPGKACTLWLPDADGKSVAMRRKIGARRMMGEHTRRKPYITEEQLAEMRREMQKDFEGDGGNE